MTRTLCGLLAGMAALTALPAAGEEPRPRRLDDFEIHQYVGSRGLSPLVIMRLDTNGEVLIACRQPRTRDELRAMSVEAIESQLVLLRAMRLLRLEGGRFETLVPLLDAEATGRLRQATAALAPEIVSDVRTEVEELGAVLAEAGFGEHLYAVLFSYILDGMAWEFFEEYSEVLPRRLSAASPHWSGEVWGTYPPRPRAVGTSAIVSGDLKMRISRPGAAGSSIDGLLADWRDLRDLLRRYADPEAAGPDAAALERLAGFGVVGEDGGLALPIFVEKPGEPVFELAQDVTEKVTDAARDRLPLEKLAADLGLRDRRQAMVIAYHELMWDLMDAFEADGLVSRPRLLEDPAGAGRTDVAAAAFVVDRRREKPKRQDEEKTGEDD